MGRQGKQRNTWVKFTDTDIGLIVQTLPPGVDPARLELLPKVLQDWGRIDLPRHLSISPRAFRERTKAVDVVFKGARELLQAFDALDEAGLRRVAHYVGVHETAVMEKPAY